MAAPSPQDFNSLVNMTGGLITALDALSKQWAQPQPKEVKEIMPPAFITPDPDAWLTVPGHLRLSQLRLGQLRPCQLRLRSLETKTT